MDPRLRHQGVDEQIFSVLAEKVLLLDGWGAVAVLRIICLNTIFKVQQALIEKANIVNILAFQ